MSRLGKKIELLSGQHIEAANTNTMENGVPYLTGPADFIGKKPVATKYTEFPKVCCDKGDILITVKGSGTGSIAISDATYCISRQLMAIRCKDINPFFAQYLLELNEKKFNSSAAGLIPGISRTDVLNLRIPQTQLPEQKAIADLLSTWDEAIGKTEQLIAKKQKFYEAQLSKHLSLNIPERIKLKKFLKEVSKRNRDLSITQVLSVTNSKGFVRPEDQFDRQVASDNLSNYKIVSKGEYAYNPSRINVGSIARLDGWDFGILSPMYTVFEIKKPSELHTDLFLHWLNSEEAKKRIKLSAQGSVRETVSFDDFCAIGFPKIDFKEQKALAEYFSCISEEIDTLKVLFEKYKTQKRGLMQKMLTGEWRVKPEIVNQYIEA